MAWYRLNRAAYLAWGRRWSTVRGVLVPLNLLARVLVPSEIDYRADIGPGLRILHPQLGVVVGARVVAGAGLILAGGNAVGDGVVVGAGAVVVHDFAGPGTLVGVPARPA